MRRWLLVANNLDCWMELDKEELTISVDKPVRKGDKVLVYKTSPHNHFSHLFQVKNDTYKIDKSYKMVLSGKKPIDNPITLKEIKKLGYLDDWQTNFKKSFHPIQLCRWGKIIGLIIQKNPGLLDSYEAEGCYGPHNEGFPQNKGNKLNKYLKDIRKYNVSNFNEEAAKYRLILPTLFYLGWDIYDLNQIFPEFSVKNSTKKVDYLLTDHKANQLLIEVKKPNENLDDHNCQLIEYCASKNIDQGILTNGVEWRFYNFNYYDKHFGAIKSVNIDETINIQVDPVDEIKSVLIDKFWNSNTCKEGKLFVRKSNKEILKMTSEIKDSNISLFNESAVKQCIVIPILENLGWIIYDDKELIFYPETTIKYKKNKSLKKKIHLDYALIADKKICIEVKKMGIKELYVHAGPVKDFCEKKNFDTGIVTDGKIWEFVIFKNNRFYEEKTFDIDKESEVLLEYFDKYLKKIT